MINNPTAPCPTPSPVSYASPAAYPNPIIQIQNGCCTGLPWRT